MSRYEAIEAHIRALQALVSATSTSAERSAAHRSLRDLRKGVPVTGNQGKEPMRPQVSAEFPCKASILEVE